MAVGETPVTVVGTVCSDLEVRQVGERRHEMVMFWLRSNERRYDRERETWVDGRHCLVRVKCWRRLAAGVRASVRRGDPVIVSGRLRTSGAGNGGQARAVPEVEALAVGPNLSRCVAPAQGVSQEDLGEGGDGSSTLDLFARNPRTDVAEPARLA